jgi:hypothetical protein
VAVSFIGGSNHQPAAGLWQTLSHTFVHLAMSGRFEFTTLVVIDTDYKISKGDNHYLKKQQPF